MSRDGCVALPRGAMCLSAVCDCIFFSVHTHLLFLQIFYGTKFSTSIYGKLLFFFKKKTECMGMGEGDAGTFINWAF